MNAPETQAENISVQALLLFAADPRGLGGVVLRGPAGPMRDRWMKSLYSLFRPDMPVRRMPFHVSEDRLLGGLDLATTLQAGRPVFESGLLGSAHGGLLVVGMAERIPPLRTAILCNVMDMGELPPSRDGVAAPAQFGVVAFDEGAGEERAPAPLMDRLAFMIAHDLSAYRAISPEDIERVTKARLAAADVEVGEALLEAICATAMALGVHSFRAVSFAVRAAKAAAAIAGRAAVGDDDVALAAKLVFAHRATVLPAPADEEEAQTKEEPQRGEDGNTESASDRPLEDMVLESTRAVIPPDVLAQIEAGLAARRGKSSGGRSGASKKSKLRGRPAGVRQGDLRQGARLNLIATLTAAAPWQSFRRRQAGAAPGRISVRREDFRITRFKERTATTTIFVVDGSGSAALHRLTEAKGAVELLLADCYVRRDQVALISFRRDGAELLLPPTRSLARAKRSLAGLAGGGGTPLAAGIDAAAGLADGIRRKGQTPVVIFLTDGQGNVARDGQTGRARGNEDALAAARMFRQSGVRSILIDTSPRSAPEAQKIAAELEARYLALPHADAGALQRGVIAATSD